MKKEEIPNPCSAQRYWSLGRGAASGFRTVRFTFDPPLKALCPWTSDVTFLILGSGSPGKE